MRIITICMVIIFLGVLTGCGNPDEKDVKYYTQRCIIMGRFQHLLKDPTKWEYSADGKTRSRPGVELSKLQIINRFTKSLEGEKVYCYDIQWTHNNGSTNYRIEVVLRGKRLEILNFQQL